MGIITPNSGRDEAPNESPIPETFHREDEAYRNLLPELLETYREEFVAIHGGKLADHDADPFILGKRVRKAFGTEFVLIRAVDPSYAGNGLCFDLVKPISDDL